MTSCVLTEQGTMQTPPAWFSPLQYSWFSPAVCLNSFASSAKLAVRVFRYCRKYISAIIYHGLSPSAWAAGEVQRLGIISVHISSPALSRLMDRVQVKTRKNPCVLTRSRTIKKVAFFWAVKMLIKIHL